MSVPKRVNASGIVSSADTFFIESASLHADAASVLEIYDGATPDGKLIAILACAANGADHNNEINYECTQGCYAMLTPVTGSGYGVGLIYQR